MSTSPHETAAAGTARRAPRRPRVQRLVTADEHSLTDLETLLATLPLCTTGRVFVEVPDASHIRELVVPSRMILTWLDRSRRSGEPGSGRACAPGQALTRAVTAWADEMMCDEEALESAERTQAYLLGGYIGTADIADHLVERLAVDPEAVHTPARFGLLVER